MRNTCSFYHLKFRHQSRIYMLIECGFSSYYWYADHGSRTSQCHWGKCISSFNICDGNNDCGDWSEEVGCGGWCLKHPTTQLTVKNVFDLELHVHVTDPCTEEQVRCDASDVHDGSSTGDYYCLPASYRCDGIRDCFHGEDESEETCVAGVPYILRSESSALHDPLSFMTVRTLLTSLQLAVGCLPSDPWLADRCYSRTIIITNVCGRSLLTRASFFVLISTTPTRT